MRRGIPGKLGKAYRFARYELGATRQARRDLGIRRALAQRGQANLGLAGMSEAVAGAQSAADAAAARAAEAELRAAEAESRAAGAAQAADALRQRLGALQAETEDVRMLAAGTAWAALTPPSDTLVSVLMPTRDRAALLPAAIASVRAQSHGRFELIVIDDGSLDDTAAVVEAIDDPRVRLLRRERDERPGSAAALNAGLAEVRGRIVAYLDDDNAMQPHWLAAVVAAFDHRPDVDVVYGARVFDPGDPRMPALQWEPWARRTLEKFNLMDQNVVAHRAGLPGAVLDEELEQGADWDLALRLTEDKPPLRLPVVAVAYRTHAQQRLSDHPGARQSYALVQRKLRERRPLRVLGVNAMFPLVTETYIHDELQALEQHGAEIAWYRDQVPPSPMAVRQPVYADLELAVAEFRPDVLFLHWATFAVDQLERLERIGLPFGVRVHSFDAVPELAAALRGHPLCIGVWSYPSPGHADLGTHTLAPIFSSVGELPDSPPSDERSLVLSISAGLPKKDWPLLLDAFGGLRGVERRVVLGVTKGHETEPSAVVALAAGLEDPPLVQVNLAREQAHELYARAAVLVYTLAPGVRFGMPMSVVEGMCAGCCVVLPDRAECAAFVGEHFRGYTTAGDIVDHVRDVLAGGPGIAAEREANRARARERFADPALGASFYAQLRDGVERWRSERSGLEPLPDGTAVSAD